MNRDELLALADAPKDGTHILAQYKALDGERNSFWDGRWFVISHAGQTTSGYDMGWNLFPGYGGCSDHNFYGWLPLPAAALRAIAAQGD